MSPQLLPFHETMLRCQHCLVAYLGATWRATVEGASDMPAVPQLEALAIHTLKPSNTLNIRNHLNTLNTAELRCSGRVTKSFKENFRYCIECESVSVFVWAGGCDSNEERTARL